MCDFSNLYCKPTNANWYDMPYHILLITSIFPSLLQHSSGYLHKNTDKIQQTAIVYE